MSSLNMKAFEIACENNGWEFCPYTSTNWENVALVRNMMNNGLFYEVDVDLSDEKSIQFSLGFDVNDFVQQMLESRFNEGSNFISVEQSLKDAYEIQEFLKELQEVLLDTYRELENEAIQQEC